VLDGGQFKCVEVGSVPAEKYVNNFDYDNPLGVKVESNRSDNYFLVLGDWGKGGDPGYCQKKVSQMIVDYVNLQKQ